MYNLGTNDKSVFATQYIKEESEVSNYFQKVRVQKPQVSVKSDIYKPYGPFRSKSPSIPLDKSEGDDEN